MEKKLFRVFAVFGLMVLVFGVFAVTAPAHADSIGYPQQNETPVPPGDDGAGATIVVTNVIPDTGDDDADDGVVFTSTWLLLVIVGVALMALVIGLLARGSGSRID